MVSNKFFVERKIVIALAVYLLLSGILLFHFGLQTGGEAEKYIDNANRILQHRELRNGFFGIFYVVYSLLVALFVKCSIPLIVVAGVQILFSATAALCLYKLLLRSIGNSPIAFLFFIAYLCCYPIQKWNFFLYSESLHTSLLVIGVYAFQKMLLENKRAGILLFGFVGLLILFSRPVGLIFSFAAGIALLVWLYRNNKHPLCLGLLISGIGVLVLILNSPVTSFVNPDSLKRMEVICQVPTSQGDTSYLEFNRAGLVKAFMVIRDDIGWGNFFSIGVKKLGSFFGMWRPYYSWQNNFLLLLYCIFYPFALLGIFLKQPPEFYYIKLLSVAYLLLTCLAIFFTCDDWANRFISPAFPFVLILAACGVWSLFKQKKSV